MEINFFSWFSKFVLNHDTAVLEERERRLERFSSAYLFSVTGSCDILRFTMVYYGFASAQHCHFKLDCNHEIKNGGKETIAERKFSDQQ